MHIINRSTIKRYVKSREGHRSHRALKNALDTWWHTVQSAQWENMSDVKSYFRSADPLTAERVVFDIKGNEYRLVAAIDFRRKWVFLKWIGTHGEYDKIDAKTVEQW